MNEYMTPSQAVVKPSGSGDKAVLGGLLTMLLAVPLLQFVGNYNYELHLLLYAFMYITLTSSWNILGGYGGYISLSHNVFFCIGAYFSGYVFVRYGISPFYTAWAAAILAAAFGFVIGLITLRVRGPAFIISSIALVMIFRILFDHWELVGAANGLTLPYSDLDMRWAKIPHYYAFLTLAVLALLLSWYVRNSRFGLALRALSHDEVKCEVAGINVRLVKVIAFALSTFFVGAAGAIWGDYLTYIRPNIFLTILIAANIVLMCILGGKGTVAGPVVGTVAMIFFNEFIVANFGASELNILLTGLLLVLTLRYFPEGIVGSLKKQGRLPGFLDW